MSTGEEARETATKHRQKERNTEKTMLDRSEAEIAAANKDQVTEEARETATEHRQSQKNRQDSVLSRSSAEVHTDKNQ